MLEKHLHIGACLFGMLTLVIGPLCREAPKWKRQRHDTEREREEKKEIEILTSQGRRQGILDIPAPTPNYIKDPGNKTQIRRNTQKGLSSIRGWPTEP